MPSRAHVLTLLHTRDDDDALTHPRARPPPYTTTMITTPSTALPSLPCEGTEAIVQCTPLCALCLCFCSPHLCPPSLLMPMCIPTADNNDDNDASSSSSSLPSLCAQQHDDTTTTTTLLPSRNNIIVVVTPILACPHPRACPCAPDDMTMTTTTLSPSHDSNVVVVVTPVLACPHPRPRAPDNTT